MAEEPMEPTEEELRAAFEEQMRQVRVEDVILQTVATMINLAARRLGLGGDASERDPEQAKLAIDAARALVPLCPEEQAAAVKDAMAQVQMAYARETSDRKAQSAERGPQTSDLRPQASEVQDEAGGRDAQDEAGQQEAERARARAKIWTPPGA